MRRFMKAVTVTGTILATTWAAAGCGTVEMDCENSTFDMDYNDGTPIFNFNLYAVDGESYDVVFEVMWLGDATDATCDWNSADGMWELKGDFNQVVYGQVPEGGKVTFDATEADVDWTSELLEGRAYAASVWLKQARGSWVSCPSMEYVWVQGDPDSIIHCE